MLIINLVPLLQLEDDTFTVVDFACSHGKNSMSVINQLLDGVNNIKDVQNIKSMMVYHNDLPDNNFDEVMKCVNDTQIGYKSHNMFTSKDIQLESRCIGRTYYQQIVEDESVDFAFCYTSLHWMPEYRDLDFGLMYVPQTGELELNQWFDYNSENYLKQWLSLRYEELKPSGIVSFNVISYSNFNDNMNSEWTVFLKSKGISTKDLSGVNIPVVCRPRDQISSAIESFVDQYKVVNFDTIEDSAKLCRQGFKAICYNQIISGLSKHETIFPTHEERDQFYQEFEDQCYSTQDYIKFDTVTEWILLQKI
jgi:hypothetical protein